LPAEGTEGGRAGIPLALETVQYCSAGAGKVLMIGRHIDGPRCKARYYQLNVSKSKKFAYALQRVTLVFDLEFAKCRADSYRDFYPVVR
jgi:hypothetical protein